MTRLHRGINFAGFMVFTAIVSIVAGALMLAAGGCAGDAARVHASAPQIAAMAPDILEDAAIGARVQALAGAQQAGQIELPCDLVQQLNIPPISEGFAESKREHRERFRALIDQLARKSGDGG